jgi:hypothetical protein
MNTAAVLCCYTKIGNDRSRDRNRPLTCEPPLRNRTVDLLLAMAFRAFYWPATTWVEVSMTCGFLVRAGLGCPGRRGRSHHHSPHFPCTLSFMAARRRRNEGGISFGHRGPCHDPNAIGPARGLWRGEITLGYIYDGSASAGKSAARPGSLPSVSGRKRLSIYTKRPQN